MKRFTRWDGQRFVFTNPYNEDLSDSEVMQLLLNRLARYEGTDLSPSDVVDLQKRAHIVEQMTGATLHHIVELLQREGIPCSCGTHLTSEYIRIHCEDACRVGFRMGQMLMRISIELMLRTSSIRSSGVVSATLRDAADAVGRTEVQEWKS